MSSSLERFLVRYTGQVQGVGFRFTSLAQARGLDVHGFVRNEPDGTVLMDVEGKSHDVKELLGRIAAAMEGKIEFTDLDPRAPRGAKQGFHIQH